MGRALRVVISAFCAFSASAFVCPPAGAADDAVTYEISSDSVGIVNIEYMNAEHRILVERVPLPWRMDTAVLGGKDRSEVRADWRPSARPNKWVTVRILYRGDVICQSTLDIGNATCYGNTPHVV